MSIMNRTFNGPNYGALKSKGLLDATFVRDFDRRPFARVPHARSRALQRQPVEVISGIQTKLGAALRKAGIDTVGQFIKASPSQLASIAAYGARLSGIQGKIKSASESAGRLTRPRSGSTSRR